MDTTYKSACLFDTILHICSTQVYHIREAKTVVPLTQKGLSLGWDVQSFFPIAVIYQDQDPMVNLSLYLSIFWVLTHLDASRDNR
jgi:hypothetical protein